MSEDLNNGGAGGGAGDNGGDGAGTGSASINLDLAGAGGNGGEGGENTLEIPEAYADKDWAKGMTSVEDVFKFADSQNSLVGKKVIGIPTEESSEAEVSAFNKAFGIPDNVEGYEIEQNDSFKQLYGDSADEVTKAFQGAFHEAKLNSAQAKVLQAKYGDIVGGILQKVGADKEARNAEFEEISEKAFGNDRGAILDDAAVLLKENAPEGFENHIAELDNQSLAIMAGVLNNIKNKYISEDSLGPKGNGGGGRSADDIRTEMHKILSSDEFKNPLHANSSNVKQRYTELAGLLDQAQRNQK